MADRIAFELVSPERLLLSVDADMVVVPGAEGDFAVLIGHQPMISLLRPGSIDVYDGDKVTQRVFVAGGFVEVTGERLVVLAEEATAAGDVDRAALAERIAAARKALEEMGEQEHRRSAAEEFLIYLEHMYEVSHVH